MSVNLDVGFAVDEKGLLQTIDNAAAYWRKAFDNIGSAGIDEAIKRSAKVAKESAVETTNNVVQEARRAASLKIKAEQDYAELKAKYVLEGLEETRKAIHEEEQAVKTTRNAIALATQEGLAKETVAVLKAERDKQNARLQGLRSVEKEVTGARTFTEQLEKNVYGPVKEESKKGGALALMLFGQIGALEKELKKTESEVKAHETKIAEHAKQAKEQIEAQERVHAEKLKALESEISNAKSAEAKKELEAVRQSIQEQIAEEKRLTHAKASEENLQLQQHKAHLEKELADTKSEHAKEKAESDAEAAKGEKGKGRGLVGSVMSGAAFGAGLEAFKAIKEHAEEAVAAQRALAVGTGKTGVELEKLGKQAEEIGDKFAISGETAKMVEGQVASYTGTTGEELKKQTEAALAYAAAHHKNAEAIGKMLKSESGRANIMREAEMNVAKASQEAQSPAANMERIQNKLMETVGNVAMVVMNALGPALKAITPLLDTVGELANSVIKPAFEALSPLMAQIGNMFKELAPIVVQLIESALSILAPLLSDITDITAAVIPVVLVLAKTIGNLLTPILDALKPVLLIVADIIKQVLVQNVGVLNDVLQGALVPVLQIVAPLIQVLAPILQLVAGLIQSLVLPIFLQLQKLAMWPLTQILKLIGQGFTALQKPIQDVIGWITSAIDKIKGAVSAVTDFLGLGDDAKKKAAEGGKAVAESAGKASQEEAAQQAAIADGQRRQRDRSELAQKLKAGKLSANEESQLRELAQDEGDEIMLKKLDDFDKKRSAKGASSAKKDAKARFEAAKASADEILNEKREEIAAEDLTDRLAKSAIRSAEILHQQQLIEIARNAFGERSKQYQSAVHQLQAKQASDRKEDRSDLLADAEKDTEELIAEFNIRADKELLSDQQRKESLYQLQREGINARLALIQVGSEEESKLRKQLTQLDATHYKEEREQLLAFTKEVEQIRLEQRKTEIEKLKEHHTSRREVVLAEQQLSIDEETARWKEEQLKRGADMRANDALREALERNHQNKLIAIEQNAAKEQKQIQLDNLKLYGAPAVTAWHNLANAATSGLKKMTDGWRQMGGVGGGVLADITDGIVQMGVQFIEQQVAMLAESLVTTTTATATQVASMEVIKAEAVPAAAAVSAATAGVSAATGGASLIGMLAGVLGAFGMADGGFVGGAGGERDDRNWRRLSRTEFVVNGKQAPKWAPVLHAINDGADPMLSGGEPRTIMLDEGQVRRLERNTVLSSNRMLLDNRKTQQQRSRQRI